MPRTVVHGGVDVVDGAGSDDHDEAVVHAAQHVGDALASAVDLSAGTLVS